MCDTRKDALEEIFITEMVERYDKRKKYIELLLQICKDNDCKETEKQMINHGARNLDNF